jgi:hypothetical protein
MHACSVCVCVCGNTLSCAEHCAEHCAEGRVHDSLADTPRSTGTIQEQAADLTGTSLAPLCLQIFVLALSLPVFLICHQAMQLSLGNGRLKNTFGIVYLSPLYRPTDRIYPSIRPSCRSQLISTIPGCDSP